MHKKPLWSQQPSPDITRYLQVPDLTMTRIKDVITQVLVWDTKNLQNVSGGAKKEYFLSIYS